MGQQGEEGACDYKEQYKGDFCGDRIMLDLRLQWWLHKSTCDEQERYTFMNMLTAALFVTAKRW